MFSGNNLGFSERDLEIIRGITQSSNAKPHLVSTSNGLFGNRLVTVHTVKAVSERSDRKRLLSDLRKSGVKANFRIRNHSAKKIASATSLEKLNSGYDIQSILVDPIGSFSRSSALVNFARQARSQFGKKIAGIYLQPQWRTIFVVLDHRLYFSEDKAQRADLAETETTVRQLLVEFCGEQVADYINTVRLSFEVPSLKLVPVDAASYTNRLGFFSGLRKNLKAPAFATMLGLAGTVGASQAIAADPNAEEPYVSSPAVSGPNAKISISGGFLENDANGNSDNTRSIAGAVTVPLSERFGLQIDGAAGSIDNDDYWGVGGHLFWRDPDVGLLGIIGSYAEVDRDSALFVDEEIGFVGLEGEVYRDQFTLMATAGSVFGENVDDGFAGSIDFGWYATDDFLFTLGASHSEDSGTLGTASIEWQPAVEGMTGLSFFAEGAVGEDDYSSVNAGIRFYFGEGPTLKDRHRRDDPPDNVVEKAVKNFAGSSKKKTESSYLKAKKS